MSQAPRNKNMSFTGGDIALRHTKLCKAIYMFFSPVADGLLKALE